MKLKKIASAIIALALAGTMGTTAFADGTDPQNADIKVLYTSETPPPVTIYSVDIAWGSLNFTYDSNNTQSWNADTHKFEVTPGTPSWSCDEGADKVTVTNHSNTAIEAGFVYAQKNESGIDGSFDKNKVILDAPAEGSNPAAAPAGTVQLSLNGAIDNTEKTEVGEVTVTVTGLKPDMNVTLGTGGIINGVDYTLTGSAEVKFTENENVYEIIVNVTAMTQKGNPSEYAIAPISIECAGKTFSGYYTSGQTISTFESGNTGRNFSTNGTVMFQFGPGAGTYSIIVDATNADSKDSLPIKSFTKIN